MIARAILLVAYVAVGCASPRAWQPSYTARTTFEGEPVEIASGYEIKVSCDKASSPLWGCTDKEYALNETIVRWGPRKLTLDVNGHIGAYQPVPRLRSVSLRRLGPRMVAFDVRAAKASWGGASFLCLQPEPQRCVWGYTPVDLPPGASLETAHAQALARGWPPQNLDNFFGPSPQHHALAIVQREWSYLLGRWPSLAPATRQRALAAAIAHDQEWILKKQWDDLDAANLRRAIELFVENDRYAFFASAEWWSRLSPEMQQYLVQLAIDGVASMERERFLKERFRATGDARLERALQRRW